MPEDLHGADRRMPKERIKGKVNPEYLRAKMARLNEMNELSIRDNGKPITGMKDQMAAIAAEANYAGYDPKHLVDIRTESEKVADGLEALAASERGDEMLEQLDDLITAMRKQIDEAVVGCSKNITEQKVMAQKEHVSGKGGPLHLDEIQVQRLEKWSGLMHRLLTIRALVREKVPTNREIEGVPDWDDDEYIPAWEATWCLRYQLYVGRCQQAEKRAGTLAEELFEFGEHHTYMAMCIWQAQNKVAFEVPFGCSKKYPRANVVRDVAPYEGALLCVPPAHGKSELVQHWLGLEIHQNTSHQVKIVHAQNEMAWDMTTYVAAQFDIDDCVGRRAAALFGPKEIEQKSNTQFRLKLANRLKDPTCIGSGIMAQKSGANASIIVFDDIVDQKAMTEEPLRKKAFARVNGTWIPRIRGDGMHVTVCTLWHPDDANARRIQLARRGESWVRVGIRACGGPKAGPDVTGRYRGEFEPVWKKRITKAKLIRVFKSMKDPGLFSSAYQCNPVTESRRVVKLLRLYDPLAPEHKQFLRTSVKRLTIDPAATNSETSDPAGVLYLGDGDIIQEERTGQGTVIKTERRIRILDAFQIPSTQHEIAALAGGYCRQHPVDYVHFEARSGFNAASDEFKNLFGVEPIRHDPGPTKKIVRLKAVAPMIENANTDMDIHAVVEFPGAWNDNGELVFHPDFEWLQDQIINAGMTKDDHALDALTQVLNMLAPDMGIGIGLVTSAVREAEPSRIIDSRLAAYNRKMFKDMSRDKPDEDAERELAWMKQAWQ